MNHNCDRNKTEIVRTKSKILKLLEPHELSLATVNGNKMTSPNPDWNKIAPQEKNKNALALIPDLSPTPNINFNPNPTLNGRNR